MGPADAPAEAGDGAPGARVPVRAAEAGEGGHDDHPLGRVDRTGQRLEFGRLVDDAEPVPQPLDAGPGDEDRTLDGVGQ